MKTICRLILSVFCLTLIAEKAFAAQGNPYEFRIIYSFMKNKNVDGLQNAINNGVWIDAPDSNGINSLCHAIYQKDYEAYELLKSLQADTNPACLHRMSAKYRNAFFEDMPNSNRYAYLEPEKAKEPFITRKVETIGTIAAFTIAGIIGTNSGSGGSGGESGGGEGGGESGGSNNPALDNLPSEIYFRAPKNDDPATFKTTEFEKGNFLSPIKAEYAYARGYNGFKVERTIISTPGTDGGPATETVSFNTTTDKLTVAIYDGGVDSSHPKLAPNILTNSSGTKLGYNFDYGPCTATNNKICYQYDIGRNVLQLKKEDGTIVDLYSSFTQANWNSYTSKYNAAYVWNVNDASPHTVEDPANPTDYDSHGTHVAGIVGAIADGTGMHGVAYNVNLLPIIYNNFATANDLAFDINSISEDIDIINMSFGPDSSPMFNAANPSSYLDNITALTELFNKNIIVVAAAGNESQTEPNALHAIPDKVANAENLFITVVAVDSNGNITDYSNKCGSAAKWCIAAPGGTATDPIYSTANGGGYADMVGTSMAAPTVSGSLAVLMGAFPNLTPQQAVAILLETAGNADGSYNETTGHGMLNLDAATNPVGILNIPTSDTTTTSLLALRDTNISLPYNMGSLVNKLPEKFIVLDKYSRPYPFSTKGLFKTADNDETLKNNMNYFINHNPVKKIKLNDNVSMSFSNRVTDPNDQNLQMGSMAFDYQVSKQSTFGFFYTENTLYKNGDYFSKANSNPFLNLNDAFGVKSEYKFNHQLSFDVAMYTGKNGFYNDDHRLKIQNDNQFNAIDYSFNYAPTDFINFGFKSGFLQEDGSILGIKGDGALSTQNTLTTYNGLEINVKPADQFSVTAAYYQGSSKTNSANDSLLSLSDLASESISLDISYLIDKYSKIGFQAVSPLSVSRGNLMIDLPTGRDPSENKVYREKYNISMKPEAKELDLGFYFTHETEDEKWFRAEMTTRLNPDNQNIDPDYQIMLGYGMAI